MKLEKKLCKVMCLALITTCMAIKANAAFANYTIGNGGLETFTGSFDGAAIDGGAGFYAGGIQITGGGPGLPGSYTTVCTDLGGTIYLGNNYGYSAPTLFSASTGLSPAWGYSPAAAPAAIENAAYIFYNNGNVLNGTDNSAKAGLQLAVWEALYDTGNPNASLNVGTSAGSRFQITSGDSVAIADANSYLEGLTGNYNYQGYLLVPDPTIQYGLTAQELLIGAGDFSPVPEPATYGSFAAAGLLLVSLRSGLCRKQAC